MRVIPFIAVFVTGCFSYPYATNFQVDADLPEMDLDCDYLFEEQNGGGAMVFVDVQQVGDVCRGRGFASVTAVEWADLEEIPDRARIDWREVLTEVTDLELTTNDGAIPAGVVINVEQLVATASGDLAALEGDWEAAVSAMGTRPVADSDTMLFSVEHTFTGSDPSNLIDVVDVVYNEAGPLSTINASYADGDPELKVITLATVDVPISELDTDPTEISISVGQAVDFTARVRVRLLPGG